MGGAGRLAAVAALTLGAGLAACAPGNETAGDEAAETGPPSAAAAEACQAAVAAHVGKAGDAVAVAWLETRPGGVEVFEAIDGARRHVCAVDAAGRVLGVDHPAE